MKSFFVLKSTFIFSEIFSVLAWVCGPSINNNKIQPSAQWLTSWFFYPWPLTSI